MGKKDEMVGWHHQLNRHEFKQTLGDSEGLGLQGDQSVLREINPEYSLEGRMLKPQYFSHLMQRADSLEKTLRLRKIEGKRGREL